MIANYQWAECDYIQIWLILPAVGSSAMSGLIQVSPSFLHIMKGKPDDLRIQNLSPSCCLCHGEVAAMMMAATQSLPSTDMRRAGAFIKYVRDTILVGLHSH